jgi:hypothetical protein
MAEELDKRLRLLAEQLREEREHAIADLLVGP